MTVNIISIKWGKRYGPEYVNRLYSGVARHLSRPFRFVCFTDDTQGIRREVDTYPIPESVNQSAISHFSHGKKQHLFQNDIGDLQGTCLYLDLDVVIVDSIDCFFDYKPGQFCICKEWLPVRQQIHRKLTKRQRSANSSVFRFEANTMQFIVDRLNEDPQITRQFRLEQYWLSYALGDQMNWWPLKWVGSFKHRRPIYPLSLVVSPILPKSAKVMVFNGPLKPTDAINGRFVLSPRKFCRPTAWVKNNWVD